MTQVGLYLIPIQVAVDYDPLQMMGQMRAGNPEQAPEERFASQLDQLASMGFVDRQANIQGGGISLHEYPFLNYLTCTHFSSYCYHG